MTEAPASSSAADADPTSAAPRQPMKRSLVVSCGVSLLIQGAACKARKLSSECGERDSSAPPSSLHEADGRYLQHYRAREAELYPSVTQLRRALRAVTPHNRGVLLRWLQDCCRMFRLMRETYFLCVNYLDRYLAHTYVAYDGLQLVALTCLWIASKYEEVRPPGCRHFAQLTNNVIRAQQLCEMEATVLAALGYELGPPTAIKFFELFAQEVGVGVGDSAPIRALAVELIEASTLAVQFRGAAKPEEDKLCPPRPCCPRSSSPSPVCPSSPDVRQPLEPRQAGLGFPPCKRAAVGAGAKPAGAPHGLVREGSVCSDFSETLPLSEKPPPEQQQQQQQQCPSSSASPSCPSADMPSSSSGSPSSSCSLSSDGSCSEGSFESCLDVAPEPGPEATGSGAASPATALPPSSALDRSLLQQRPGQAQGQRPSLAVECLPSHVAAAALLASLTVHQCASVALLQSLADLACCEPARLLHMSQALWKLKAPSV